MVCYTGTNAAGMYRVQQTTVGCLTVTVAQCIWYVQDKDLLIQIVVRFSTNWLQVWHFNPTLLRSDDLLVQQSLLYQVTSYSDGERSPSRSVFS